MWTLLKSVNLPTYICEPTYLSIFTIHTFICEPTYLFIPSIPISVNLPTYIYEPTYICEPNYLSIFTIPTYICEPTCPFICTIDTYIWPSAVDNLVCPTVFCTLFSSLYLLPNFCHIVLDFTFLPFIAWLKSTYVLPTAKIGCLGSLSRITFVYRGNIAFFVHTVFITCCHRVVQISQRM